MLESIREFCYWLGVDPIWIAIIIGIMILGCFCPWDLDGKTEITKDKDGNVTYRHFRLK